MVITSSTPMIRLNGMQYPKYLKDLKAEAPNISFPETITDYQAAGFGYVPVRTVPRPEGNVVTELPPIEIDNEWVQVWTSRDFTEAEISQNLENEKTRLQDELNTKRTEEMFAGVEYTFPSGNVKTIQTRERDHVNLIAARINAEAYISAGLLDTQLEFRTYENTSEYMTPQEMMTLTSFVLSYMSTIMTNSWRIKDMITEAQDMASLPVIPDKIHDFQIGG